MEDLNTSELGTQEYWDNQYDEELENFQTHGDPGEIWFGQNISKKIHTWIHGNSSITPQSEIIDIGCGNGMFLIALSRHGYKNLHGVDYSKSAIALSSLIAEKEHLSINYSVCDILDEGLNGQYDVIHDKGTYDAVCLHENVLEHRVKYIKNVCNALNEDGYFIITSCNYTQDELQEHFKNAFVCVHIFPVTQFQFGGKVGNVVTSVVYKKIKTAP